MYLFPFWVVGVVIRYLVLFPLRLANIVLSLRAILFLCSILMFVILLRLLALLLGWLVFFITFPLVKVRQHLLHCMNNKNNCWPLVYAFRIQTLTRPLVVDLGLAVCDVIQLCCRGASRIRIEQQ